MKFAVKSEQALNHKTPCLVLPIFQGKKLSASATEIDNASNGALSRILSHGDIDGKIGDTLFLYDIPNCSADRVLLVGCGKERDIDTKKYTRIHEHFIKALNKSDIIEAVSYLTQLSIKGRDAYWANRLAAETITYESYRYEALKSKKTTHKCKRLIFTTTSKQQLPQAEKALTHAQATMYARSVARDLGNTPPNYCTPKDLVSHAQKITKELPNLSCKILDEETLEKENAHSLIAVGRGSIEPSYLIELTYQGAENKKTAPIIFVGKGVTFDTGGLDLKPPAGMLTMKTDMCGAATVLAVMQAVAQLKLPLNVVGLVPTVENAIGGNAYRPSDILTTMSGQTVEVRNTDAEGRLILCDALTYAERFNPDCVIDIATLTGAMVMALGHDYSGLFGTHSPLNNELLKAGKESGDESWLMPLSDEGYNAIESPIADLQNIARTGPAGGAIIAACFLSKFAEKYRWAHLDIAGSSRTENHGVTGRAVTQLIQFLLNRVN